jgi:hypothetical protein
MPTANDKGKNFPQDPMSPERRFIAAPLSPLWSAKKKEKREKGWFGGLGFATSDFKFEFEFVCKKVLKTYQIVSRSFKYNQKVMAKIW